MSVLKDKIRNTTKLILAWQAAETLVMTAVSLGSMTILLYSMVHLRFFEDTISTGIKVFLSGLAAVLFGWSIKDVSQKIARLFIYVGGYVSGTYYLIISAYISSYTVFTEFTELFSELERFVASLVITAVFAIAGIMLIKLEKGLKTEDVQRTIAPESDRGILASNMSAKPRSFREMLERMFRPQARRIASPAALSGYRSWIPQMDKDLSLASGHTIEERARMFESKIRGSQIQGAGVLKNGDVLIMATGGGKTLTLGFAASDLKAENPDNCIDIWTTSDYLANRDAIENAEHYRNAGYKVGLVLKDGREGLLYIDGKWENVSPDRVWTKADVIYSAVSSYIFTLQSEHQRQYGQDVALRARQHIVLIDECDRILIEALSEAYQISGGYRRESMEYVQRRVAQIAQSETWKDNTNYYSEDQTRKQVTLTRSGKEELRKEIEQELGRITDKEARDAEF
ncbi:MAG: hypothetical protein AAB267_06715, partial [Candidatus Desantisbacteria bacterium]